MLLICLKRLVSFVALVDYGYNEAHNQLSKILLVKHTASCKISPSCSFHPFHFKRAKVASIPGPREHYTLARCGIGKFAHMLGMQG